MRAYRARDARGACDQGRGCVLYRVRSSGWPHGRCGLVRAAPFGAAGAPSAPLGAAGVPSASLAEPEPDRDGGRLDAAGYP